MSTKFTYYLRKHPVLRMLCLFIVIIILSSIIISIKIDKNEKPVIDSITPQIGSPGDIMIISGKDFGDTRDTSSVEIGGSSLISSLYLSWSDSQIKILIPTDVQDGLVFVTTKGGKSEPFIFANRENVPIAVRQERRAALPVIFSTTPQNLSVGQVLTITGENFGSIRNDSAVYFTPVWMAGKNSVHEIENIEQNYITAFDNDFDYESWSDTEIKVRIPDSAISGYIFVLTEKGLSNRTKISVTSPIGTKKLSSKLTYLIELSADISDIQGDENSFITLRIPRPQPSASQPYIEMTECIPEPIFDNYGKTIIHHIQTSDYINNPEKLIFKHNFVIPVYAINTNINVSKVTKLSEKNRLLYLTYTKADECVPADADEIKELAKKIVGKEINPYKRAQLIYNYLIDNYTFSPEIYNSARNSLKLISSETGDAYDFSVIFCALARSLDIPAMPISGILVDSNKKAKNHWWCEIYLENFGWLPLDPGLGAGMDFNLYHEPEDRKSFYFGNLDVQHVAFSRGWNTVKPSIVNNQTVYRPKTYALQSIWEESTVGTSSYSSFWANPIVLGIY